jgi:hypothetical protein
VSSVIHIYGASDDLVEMEGEGEVRFSDEERGRKDAEYNVYDTSRYLVSGSNGDRVYAYAIYGDEGCWYFAVGQVDEDTPIPAGWAISTTQREDTHYSAQLTIRAMDRLQVRREED